MTDAITVQVQSKRFVLCQFQSTNQYHVLSKLIVTTISESSEQVLFLVGAMLHYIVALVILHEISFLGKQILVGVLHCSLGEGAANDAAFHTCFVGYAAAYLGLESTARYLGRSYGIVLTIVFHEDGRCIHTSW